MPRGFSVSVNCYNLSFSLIIRRHSYADCRKRIIKKISDTTETIINFTTLSKRTNDTHFCFKRHQQDVLDDFKISLQKKFVKWRNFLPSIVILVYINWILWVRNFIDTMNAAKRLFFQAKTEVIQVNHEPTIWRGLLALVMIKGNSFLKNIDILKINKQAI